MSDTENKYMVTHIKLYKLIEVVCPNGMTTEKCPLRQELANIPTTEHLECDTLPNGDLVVPELLPKRNERGDLIGAIHTNSTCTRICQECRNKQR